MRTRTARVSAAMLLTVGTALGATGTAAAESSLQPELDAVHEAGMPGIQAGARDGDEGWRGAAGVRDLKTGEPMEAGSEHRVGSITKSFVAAAIMQQVEEGTIRLDTPVGEYVPELVPGETGRTVTVRMLLNHTSGINDFDHVLFASMGKGSLEDLEANRFRTWTPEELVKVGLDQEPTGAPGEKWSYSNTNYVVAGEVLEAASGQEPEDYVTEHVIEPLDLEDTYFPGTEPELGGNHSKAYEALFHMVPEPGEYSTYNMTWAGTAGALVSTPADLNDFYRALFSGEVVSPESLAEMRTTVPTGEKTGYGLGLTSIDLGECGTLWGHSGGVFGMQTQSLHSEDASRQLSFGYNLSNYQELGEDGMPKPHPIDGAVDGLLTAGLCEGAEAAISEARPATPVWPAPLR